MADEMNNASTGNPDILSQLLSNQQNTDNTLKTTNATLKSIDTSLKKVLSDSTRMSVSNARDRGYSNNPFGTRSQPFNTNMFSRNGGAIGNFTNAFEKALINGIIGDDFTKRLADIRDKLAQDLGVSFEEIPQTLGEQAGKNLLEMFKKTDWGKKGFDALSNGINNSMTRLKDNYINGVESYIRKNTKNKDYVYNGAFRQDAKQGVDVAKQAGSNVDTNTIKNVVSKTTKGVEKSPTTTQSSVLMNDISSASDASMSMADAAEKAAEMAEKFGSSASNASAALDGAGASAVGAEGAVAGLSGSLGSVLPLIPLAIAGFKFQMALTKGMQKLLFNVTGLDEALNHTKEYLNAAVRAANRREESQKKSIEEAKNRLKSDVEYLIKRPFEILNEAAQSWYDAWDQNLKTITATQGYTKSDVQALAASFADRLRDEGLTSVISSSDILTNLSKVLESGLSGKAAEEFAYIATILGETIPTQDFFSYAADYASIAANAVNQGKSQEAAIAEANSQLISFANNILYASRATGGLTTGLKDAESLFKQSVQIAQAAKTNSSSNISGVLATVAGVVGAIAPDLASGLTDAVYKAAVGGNASEIVALRSLAGINASNTEFLRQLSNNPQQVFSAMFMNLAKMQNMSADAFMEVAEGVSSVFGISMDAFARVDFNKLADAINRFDPASDSLAENLKLLKSGETTTNAEQLKYQQINQIILDEGLSYVIDSAEGRMVQEHLWQEQQTKQITEATYAVDLQGTAMSVLESLLNAVEKIQTLLTPGKWLGTKIANFVQTQKEATGLSQDIKQVLELSKVGSGNRDQLTQLTTYNRTYDLVPNIVEMYGGQSAYATEAKKLNNWYSYMWPVGSAAESLRDTIDTIRSGGLGSRRSAQSSEIRSQYKWGTISKSNAKALSLAMTPYDLYTGMGTTLSSTSLAQARANDNITRMLNSMTEYVEGNEGSYNDFIKTASKFGIANFTDALEQAGYSETQIQEQFDMLQNQMAAKELDERNKKEEQFWDSNTELLTTISDYSIKIHDAFGKFMSEWEDYFINHTVYNSAYTRESVDKIMRTERENSESAIYALADALTENDVKLLLDPTVQTNALLSQILKVVNALLNQTSTSGMGGVSLPDTIAGLSLGLINQ